MWEYKVGINGIIVNFCVCEKVDWIKASPYLKALTFIPPTLSVKSADSKYVILAKTSCRHSRWPIRTQ